MNRRFILLVIITVFCAFLGYYLFSGSDNPVTERKVKLLFPEAESKAAKITIEQGDDLLTLQINNGKWVLPDNDMYPVDSGKLNALMLKLVNVRLAQRVTDNPSMHALYGVNDDGVAQGSSKVTLYDAQGEVLGEVYLGKVVMPDVISESSIPVPVGQYIRKAADKRVYLVNDVITPKMKMGDWIVTDIMPVVNANVIRIVHQKSDGKTVLSLGAGNGAEDDLQPDGKFANAGLDEETLYLIKSGIKNLQIEDAYKEDNIKQPDYPLYGLTFDMLATYTLANGVVYRISSAEVLSRVYIKIESDVDEQVYRSAQSTEGDALPESEIDSNLQKLKEQTAKINQSYSGWFYLLPVYANKKFRTGL